MLAAMHALPGEVLAPLRGDQRAKTLAWWEALSDEERAEFVTLWDARSDDTALFAARVEGRTEWHPLPIRLRARFDLDPAAAREDAAWKAQLREWIDGHEDIDFFLVSRRFHVCRAHRVAREGVCRGVIPAGFVCPLRDTTCPFTTALALAPGASLVLERG